MNDDSDNKGSCPLSHNVSQNSLDKSLQKHIPHDKGKDKLPYKNHHHTNRTYDVINEMRKENLFCDVILVADGREVSAHKIILAACSPYFYAMFTNFEERDKERIRLQGIDYSTLQLLVDYIYSAEIHIMENNVQILLSAANLLQLTDVRDACCDFLQAQLHPSNCLGIRAFADLHGCLELSICADNYVKQHFLEVVDAEEEFFTLTSEQIVKLICSDDLMVSSEEQIFECVMSWIHYDLEKRQKNLALLIEHIRLPLLSRKYLIQRVSEEPLLKTNPQCTNFLIEALRYYLLNDKEKSLFETPRIKPRQSRESPKVLLVVGGNSAETTLRSVEYYDFKEKKWYQVSELATPICAAGFCVFNEHAYYIGGETFDVSLATVHTYDAAADQWSSCPKMAIKRSTPGVAVLGNYIYAVGGSDGSTELNSAEVYDPRTCEWRPIARMSTRRNDVGVGVIKGLLYAIGGHDGELCLSSVECYNSKKDQWEPVPQMSARRGCVGVGVLDGILYAVGGYDDELIQKSVEAFIPETKRWTPVSDMAYHRQGAGVVALNGLLYVVGGNDGFSDLVSMEVYSPRTDTWTTLPTCMEVGRSYAGVAIIDKPMPSVARV